MTHEVFERPRIDGAVGKEWRKHDRRAPDHLSIDHHKAARQSSRLALERDASEQEMRRRTADIDADRAQLERILLPDRLGYGGLLRFGQLVVLMLQLEVVHGRPDQIAGPIERGVWMTPVSISDGSARSRDSSKMSTIWDSRPCKRIASSHLRWMRGS